MRCFCETASAMADCHQAGLCAEFERMKTMNVEDRELAAIYPGGRYLRPDQLQKIEAAIIERNALKATLTAVRAELDAIRREAMAMYDAPRTEPDDELIYCAKGNGMNDTAIRIERVLEAKP